MVLKRDLSIVSKDLFKSYVWFTIHAKIKIKQKETMDVFGLHYRQENPYWKIFITSHHLTTANLKYDSNYSFV